MSCSKNLFKIARKWQKLSTPKRNLQPKLHWNMDAECFGASLVADKGHFTVYTADHKRLMVPLVWLNNEIFIELLKLSEEEFGLPCNGPIMLPCDAFFMEYLISLIGQGTDRDQEKQLLLSVVSNHSSSPPVFHQLIFGCNS